MLRIFACAALVLAAVLPRMTGPAPQSSAADGTVDATVREGTSMAVAVSPDRRTIVIDLQGGLWRLPIEGGTATRITDEYNDARQPAWSPDGASIAFQGYRDGQWRIWTVAPDGSRLRALTSGPFDDREPDWSPDGARIAFSSDRSGNYDIWELEVRTGAVRQLTRDEANDFYPTYAPDGSDIAFVSARTTGPGVYALTRDGAERLVAASAGAIGSPSWRPGDRRVLYSVVGGGGARLVLDGKDVATGEDIAPFRAQWISETDFIYASDGGIKRRSLTTHTSVPIAFSATLAVRPAAGTYTRKRRDFDSTAPRRALGIVHPVMSPDRKQIAFAALGDIWIAPRGGTPVRVTDDAHADTDPAWSPDGTRLAFSSDRAGGMDIWIRDLRTGANRRLTESAEDEMGAAWSPDGSTIAYTSNISLKQGELHVTRASGGPPRKLLDRSFGPGYPSWSADGQFIIVSALKPYSSRFREGMNYITVVPADGGAARTVAPVEHSPVGKRAGDGPVWSPDGRHLAYVSEGLLHVLPVSAAGDPTGPPRQVTSEPADSISWSGSDEILYIATDRLKLVSIAPGGSSPSRPRVPAGRGVPVMNDIMWQPKMPTGRRVVHAGRLIDMRQPAARADVDVVIDGHRIKAVEPHRAALHVGADVIDADGLTVMPGLIEAHGHLHKEQATAFGAVHLAYGITSVRSPGGHPYEALEDREAIESGRRPGPRVFYSGYLVDGARPYYPLASTSPSEAVVDMELDRASRLDYDLLKTYVRLPDLLQRRAIEGAHRIGIPVSSHEIYPSALSGVDSVEHFSATSRRGYSPKQSLLGRMYEDVIAIISKSRMTVTPTATLDGGALRDMLAREPSVTQDPRLRLFPVWARGALAPGIGRAGGPAFSTNLMNLTKAGVPIVAGVDSPLVPFGLSLHAEIERYVSAGLTPFQALRTATVNTATLLNADLGTIEPGKLADLVLVEGDPLSDIRATRRVRRVIKNGEVFEMDALLKRPPP